MAKNEPIPAQMVRSMAGSNPASLCALCGGQKGLHLVPEFNGAKIAVLLCLDFGVTNGFYNQYQQSEEVIHGGG